MANFLIAVDPDPARRAAFCSLARSRIAPLDNLIPGECACADFQALWARGPNAPVAQSADERTATVVWGAPMGEGDGRRVTVEDLGAAWRGEARATPPAYDGYFAAVTYSASGELVAGADLLGLFPVYWWSSAGVLLIGSSPELFKHHPLFRFELDLAGLTGILLTMFSFAGHTLMAGVNRLGPGHALVWHAGSEPWEVTQYLLPVSTRYFDFPATVIAEIVEESLARAVDRHVPAGTPSALTLTGGRDSRLLAGMLARLGRAPTAMTLGEAGDIEMRCARAVARTLHLEHHVVGIETDREPTSIELTARWMHCAAGFNSGDYWYCQERLRDLPPVLVNGYVMDSIIGGSHFDWAYSTTTREMSFDNLFMRNNQLAISPDRLRALLRPELFGTLVDDLIHAMRRCYEDYSEFESQRAWCFDLHHRQRFHVGAPPWQFSFGSWPVMPAVDRDVLRVTGGIAAGVLGGRRVQDEILRSSYPALAELPLDRNGYDTTPLSPRLRHRLVANLRARLEPATRRLRRPPGGGAERRFYYRILDFNGPAWKMARRRAEPHRRKLYALFDKDALDALLPAPEIDVEVADGIVDASGKRLLVGLCLWAGKHL